MFMKCYNIWMIYGDCDDKKNHSFYSLNKIVCSEVIKAGKEIAMSFGVMRSTVLYPFVHNHTQ